MNKRHFICATLISVVLLTIAFTPRSQTSYSWPLPYDPWIDVNEDGVVDIFDIGVLSSHWGSSGEPINRTDLLRTRAMGDYSCVIYKNGSNYQFRNYFGTIQDTSTNFTYIFMNAQHNASGGKIVLNGPSFELEADTTLLIDTAYTWVEGWGYETVVSVPSGHNNHIFTIIYTGTCCHLSKMTINGTGQSSSYDGIWTKSDTCGSVDGTWLSELNVVDCGRDGVHLGTDSDDGTYSNGKMWGCRISSNDRYGIYVTYDAVDWEFVNLLVREHGGTGDASFRIEGSNNRFTTIHSWGGDYEYIIAEAHSVHGLVFNGVAIMDGGNAGQNHRIYHASSTYWFYESLFSGCKFWVAKLAGTDGSYDGLHISGNAYCLSVTGCVFIGAPESGIPKEGRYGIYMDSSVRNSTLVANVFRSFNQSDPIYTTGGAGIQEGYNIVEACG